MKKQNSLINIAFASVFLAVAYVLPFLTGQVPQIGKMLCPMHIPVILCGFVCGAPWGMIVGLAAPLVRSLTLGIPVLFPSAISMAFELAVYGFISGIMFRILPKKKIYIYFSLLIAMVSGRLVWGAVQFALLGFDASQFDLSAFWAGAVANALPGIILQIVFIPVAVMLFDKFRPDR